MDSPEDNVIRYIVNEIMLGYHFVITTLQLSVPSLIGDFLKNCCLIKTAQLNEWKNIHSSFISLGIFGANYLSRKLKQIISLQ